MCQYKGPMSLSPRAHKIMEVSTLKKKEWKTKGGTGKGGTTGGLTKEVKAEKNKREKTEEIEMIEV